MESPGVIEPTQSPGALDGPLEAERLNEDDQAQRTADRFLEAAIGEHQRQAARAPRAEPGTCANCGERCLPAAPYCDADCREDHGARQKAAARGGGAR